MGSFFSKNRRQEDEMRERIKIVERSTIQRDSNLFLNRSLQCGGELLPKSNNQKKKDENLSEQSEIEQIIYVQSGKTNMVTESSSGDPHWDGVVAVIFSESKNRATYLDCCSTDDEAEVTRAIGKHDNTRISPLVTVLSNTKHKDQHYGIDRIYIPYTELQETHEPRIKCACCSKFLETLPPQRFAEIPNQTFIGFDAAGIGCLQFYAVAIEVSHKIVFTGKKVEIPLGDEGTKFVINGSKCQNPVEVLLNDRPIDNAYLKGVRTMHRELSNVESVLCCVTVDRSSAGAHLDIEIQVHKVEVPFVKFMVHIDDEWKPVARNRQGKNVCALSRNGIRVDFVAFASNTEIDDQESSKAAEGIVQMFDEETVKLLVAQHCENPRSVQLYCSVLKKVRETWSSVTDCGYKGAGQSGEFHIRDGEIVNFGLIGNIMFASENSSDDYQSLVYRKHFGSALKSFYVTPRRRTEQLQIGEGTLDWSVHDHKHLTGRWGGIPIHVPHTQKQSFEELDWDDIGLSKFVARLVSLDMPGNWISTFSAIEPSLRNHDIEEMFGLEDKEKTRVINNLILIWMQKRDKPDRIKVLIKCFKDTNGMEAVQCIKDFWSIYTVLFSSLSITRMAKLIGMEYMRLGVNLGMSIEDIEKIGNDYKKTETIIVYMLSQARNNDIVITNGTRLKDFLIEICMEVDSSPALLQYINDVQPNPL